MAEKRRDWGFGVYVHWPFCAAKCPYCDFNSHVSKVVDQDRWREALLRELRLMAEVAGPRRVDSVFFGGGTPSLMPAETVGAILDEVSRLFTADGDLEVTLEANPTSVEAGRFRAYRDAGVNRFSLGIQSLVDSDLKALGRLHTGQEALRALDVALDTDARVSIDLIYGRQHQKPEDWRREADRALATGVQHVSLYQLTIEPKTRFGELYARGRMQGLPDDARSAAFFAVTQEVCLAHGLERYEVSNHAVAGEECRHNMIYWRYGDYLGIGPGAHGRLTTGRGRMATHTETDPGAWLRSVEDRKEGPGNAEVLSRQEQALEYVLMALRTREGLSLQRLGGLDENLLPDRVLEELTAEGMVVRHGDMVSVSDRGIPLLNSIINKLI